MEKFEWNSCKDYLIKQGLMNATDEEIDEGKRRYLALYQKHYRSKSNKRQLNVWLDEKDVTCLEERARRNGLKKASQYVLHLIRKDKEEDSIPPNLLIDIEIGLLKMLDALSKTMGAKPETKVVLIDTYRQIQELIKLLAF